MIAELCYEYVVLYSLLLVHFMSYASFSVLPILLPKHSHCSVEGNSSKIHTFCICTPLLSKQGTFHTVSLAYKGLYFSQMVTKAMIFLVILPSMTLLLIYMLVLLTTLARFPFALN
jgi:hypothetical protein